MQRTSPNAPAAEQASRMAMWAMRGKGSKLQTMPSTANTARSERRAISGGCAITSNARANVTLNHELRLRMHEQSNNMTYYPVTAASTIVTYFHLPARVIQHIALNTHIARKAFEVRGPELVVLGMRRESRVVQ